MTPIDRLTAVLKRKLPMDAWELVRTDDLALVLAVVDAAPTFLHHVTKAACWPTPGIGCDGKCNPADSLRAAIAAIKGSKE